MTPSVVAPSLPEAIAQLVAGAKTVGLAHHPRRLARLARAMTRHGVTPAAVIIGAGLAWGDQATLTDSFGTITYAQLAGATRRAAAGLRHMIGPGQRVGVMAWDDRHLLVALGAASLNGASVCLLNPRIGADDLASVASQRHIEVIIAAPGTNTAAYRCQIISTESLTEAAEGGVPHHSTLSRLSILTGGTTRAPLPVQLKARPLAVLPALALAGSSGIRFGRPTLIGAPLFHGHGLICAMMCLATGAPMVLSTAIRRDGWSQDIDAAISGGVQVIMAVPAQLRALAAIGDAPNDHPVASITSGSDRLDAATIMALTSRFGPVLTNYYGATETGTCTMITGSALLTHPDSVGRPVAGCRLRIVDDAGAVVPRGTAGRVQVSSPLASAGEGWHATGDMGWVDAHGYLYLQERAGEKLRLGGEFVDLSAIEDVICQIEGVDGARAFTVDDQMMGQRVAVEVASSITLDAEAVRAVVRERLGPASVPVTVSFR